MSAADTSRPRLMLITDQGELGRALEHHISIVWPDAECRVHSPLRAGRLPSAFSAIGYDAVVLDDRCDAGRGELWLANLLHRPDFPPVLYLGPADAELARLRLRRERDAQRHLSAPERAADAVRRAAVGPHLSTCTSAPLAPAPCTCAPCTNAALFQSFPVSRRRARRSSRLGREALIDVAR